MANNRWWNGIALIVVVFSSFSFSTIKTVFNVTKRSLKRKIYPNYANLVEAPGLKERAVKYVTKTKIASEIWSKVYRVFLKFSDT